MANAKSIRVGAVCATDAFASVQSHLHTELPEWHNPGIASYQLGDTTGVVLMCGRPIIKVGSTEDELRRADDQSAASMQQHLRHHEVVKLHFNFRNWMQVCRITGGLVLTMQSEDTGFQLGLSAPGIVAATRLMSAYFRGDHDTVSAWPWQQFDAAKFEARKPEPRDEGPIDGGAETKIEAGNEYLYVLANDAMPGMVKIGRTEQPPENRARELSYATGVPSDFRVVRAFPVRDSAEAERRVHERLSAYRVSANREFFAVDPETACGAIEEVVKIATAATQQPDRMVEAIQLTIRMGRVWPGMLAGYMKLSYDEADYYIEQMRNLGVIDFEGNVKPAWRGAAPYR